MLEFIANFLFFLCWGSFLNVVGYRIVRNQGLLGRSSCPKCAAKLSWYELIPIFSWIMLRGRCKTCQETISWLYPALELLTGLVGICMVLYIQPSYWIGYFLFFSALIVTIRTDAETMLISRYMTWAFIPIGFTLTLVPALPITPLESILGAIFGYGLLWVIAKGFHRLRNMEGLGQGDLDLLAMIGAFTGPLGVWVTLLIGALLGSALGLILVIKRKRRDIKFPFGPWLALGAIIYVFFQKSFAQLL